MAIRVSTGGLTPMPLSLASSPEKGSSASATDLQASGSPTAAAMVARTAAVGRPMNDRTIARDRGAQRSTTGATRSRSPTIRSPARTLMNGTGGSGCSNRVSWRRSTSGSSMPYKRTNDDRYSCSTPGRSCSPRRSPNRSHVSSARSSAASRGPVIPARAMRRKRTTSCHGGGRSAALISRRSSSTAAPARSPRSIRVPAIH